VFKESYIRFLETDREKIVAEAISAASHHNTQPWLVKFDEHYGIELFINKDKMMNEIDLDKKLLTISQGTFIEQLTNKANSYGYNLLVELEEPNYNEELPKSNINSSKKL